MSTIDSVVNFMTGAQPRGLHNFISEIRNIDDKKDEIIRVDKEVRVKLYIIPLVQCQLLSLLNSPIPLLLISA